MTSLSTTKKGNLKNHPAQKQQRTREAALAGPHVGLTVWSKQGLRFLPLACLLSQSGEADSLVAESR